MLLKRSQSELLLVSFISFTMITNQLLTNSTDILMNEIGWDIWQLLEED